MVHLTLCSYHVKYAFQSEYTCRFTSTGASDRSFYLIFNRKVESLRNIADNTQTKKVLSAGSLCRILVPSPQSKCPQKTFIIPQKYHDSIEIYYDSHVNASQKTKTNIDFRDQAWVRPLQSTASRALFYSISIMPQVSGIL